MKKTYLVVFISLFSIILLSGCTIPSIFGGDILNIQENTQTVGTKDVLEITGIHTEPNSPLLPDMSARLFFIIHNKDETKIAENVKVRLFDAVNFKNPATRRSCNIEECNTKLGLCNITNPCRVLPGEEKSIEYELLAPSSGDIVNVRQESNLQFKAEYDFKASMIYDAIVINMEEVKRRQRAGETLSIERKMVLGSGPIQIGIELYDMQYVLAGNDAVFIFKIKNHGDKSKGSLKDSKILSGNMNITFPAGLLTANSEVLTPAAFSSSGTADVVATGNNPEEKDYFECHPAQNIPGAVSDVVCTNIKDIELYSDESMPLYFKVTNTNHIEGSPHKTFIVKSEASYTYELRDKMQVVVAPFAS